jgi:hypothetical protein
MPNPDHSHTASEPSSENSASHLPPAAPPEYNPPESKLVPPVKKRGRPKGSRNKQLPPQAVVASLESDSITPKRPVGRPPGTGPKQLASHTLSVGAPKRPVGRPRNEAPVPHVGMFRSLVSLTWLCV